eukprot:645422-Amorphochlora_amoeboformis.AAC.1
MCPREAKNFVALANNNVPVPLNATGLVLNAGDSVEGNTVRRGYTNCTLHAMDFLTVMGGDIVNGEGEG